MCVKNVDIVSLLMMLAVEINKKIKRENKRSMNEKNYEIVDNLDNLSKKLEEIKKCTKSIC